MTARISYAAYRYITATVIMLTALLFMVTWFFYQAHSMAKHLHTDNKQITSENRVMRIENKALQAVSPNSDAFINKGAPREIQDTYNHFLMAKKRYEEACKKYNYAWC